MSCETAPSPENKVGPGAVTLVVGPSGAGKDALLAGARQDLDATGLYVFPRRVITRCRHASEIHEPASVADFLCAEKAGRFALSWRAHGIHYGVPLEICEAVREGRAVVVNVSRTIIAEARRRFERVHVILIDCALPVRTQRLALRGRESRDEVLARLSREVDTFERGVADTIIDNGSSLDIGVRALVAALHGLAHKSV